MPDKSARPAAPPRAPVVCLEGPSAVGKTTLATALARAHGAVVVPELDASGAPPRAESAAWFVARHVAQWRFACALAAAAPLVVLDGDPFKGLWYNWVYAADGWPAPAALAPRYRAEVARGALAFPDLYVVLGATEAELRARRAGDATRARRGFEGHLRLVAPQRRYFAALAAADPGRVRWLGTSARETLLAQVLDAVASRGAGFAPVACDATDASAVSSALRLLDGVTRWVTTHAPEAPDAPETPAESGDDA